jgi:rRNA maturation RNase YbeY
MATAINYFKEDVRFRFLDRDVISKWVINTIRKEGFRAGTLNVIFCSDRYLRKMNKQYLQHNYNTDIITFDLSDDASMIQGDLFISIDRITANAASLNNSFTDELHRVMIHGVLHLCGYSDKSAAKLKEMRNREDHYLGKRTWR